MGRRIARAARQGGRAAVEAASGVGVEGAGRIAERAGDARRGGSRVGWGGPQVEPLR